MMKKSRLSFLLMVFSALFLQAAGQEKTYTVASAHSHNDYSRDSAFYKAYRHGFGSIEADVFLVNDELLVAHDREKVSPARTLRKLYLEPLTAMLEKDPQRHVNLLIDIKGTSDSVLPVVVQQLEPLRNYCTSGRLLVLITGDRPLPAAYSQYPDFIFYDDDLVHAHTKKEWERVGLVSLRFSLFSAWKGVGPLPEKDADRLQRIINSVHAAGKPIRFWDAPDSILGWRALMNLGVDFIGTDRVEDLSLFLQKNTK